MSVIFCVFGAETLIVTSVTTTVKCMSMCASVGGSYVPVQQQLG